MSEWTQARARLAAKSKRLPPGDPELEADRQKTRGFYVYERVAALIEDWPSLTDAQLDRVAGLLLSARKDADDGPT